jgi:hypothetical protein
MKKAMTAVRAGAGDALRLDVSGGSLQGWKTIVGLVLIQAAHQLDAFADMLKVLPGNDTLAFAQGFLQTSLPWLEKALGLLGGGAFSAGSIMVVLGILSKLGKFIKGALSLLI